MKNFSLTTLFLLLVFSSQATSKLDARSSLKSFDTMQDALLSADTCLYVQPLDSLHLSNIANEFSQEFKVPFDWFNRSIILHLDAIVGKFKIEINDKQVATNQGSYTASEFDITPYTTEGRNTLKITLSQDEISKKLESFHSNKLSLGTNNYLVSQPKIRVNDLDYSATINGSDGLLALNIKMKSTLLNTKTLKVFYYLVSPEGEVISRENKDVTLKLRGEEKVSFFAKIPEILPWSSELPNLYKLIIKTQEEGRVQEYASIDLAFRTLSFKGEDMIINGEKVDIKAVDFTPTTDTLTLSKQLDKLKEDGVNFLCLENHPAQDIFYHFADKKGFYILDRVAINTSHNEKNLSNDPSLEQEFTLRAKNTYYSSKNHPSVVAYSLAKDSNNGYNLYQSYLALKELNPSQAIIYTEADGQWNSDKFRP